MLLAGMATIPESHYEAAKLEGAGVLASFRLITFPLLKPMLLDVLILRTSQAMKVFDIIYMLTQGGPNNSTMTISYYTLSRPALTESMMQTDPVNAWSG